MTAPVAVAGAAHHPPNSANTMMRTMNTKMKFAELADSRNGTRVGVGYRLIEEGWPTVLDCGSSGP